MKLSEAEKVAEATAGLFGAFCERIEIAGSIRRRRPQVNDVDMVVIPKFAERKDLFGKVESRENLLLSAVADYVRMNPKAVKWTATRAMQVQAGLATGGLTPKSDAKYFSITGRHAQVDFFVASAATWATTLLTRTGSKEHNIWIAERAQGMRCAFKASEGIYVGGGIGMVHPESEAEFYRTLGLPFIEPVNRERSFLFHLGVELARSSPDRPQREAA